MRLVALALPMALVALLVALVRRGNLVVGIAEHDDVVRIARHTRAWRAGGLAVGLAAGVLLLGLGQDADPLGRLTALAPLAVGVGGLLGTVVGELTARPRVGVVRSAAVETRSVGDLVPRFRAGLLGVSTVVLLTVLGLGAAWGSPDDLGRAGRSFETSCRAVVDGVTTTVGSSRGPFPGSFYAVPLAIGLLVVGLLTLAALSAVVRRPRPSLESRGLDTVLRRWSASTVLTAATFTVLGTLGPVASLFGSALDGGQCPVSPAQAVARAVAVVVGPLALVGAAACLGALLVTPTIRVDDLPRPLPGDATPVGAPVR